MLLTQEQAKYYYDDLLLNHHNGTLEQKILVIRSRFDRVLQETGLLSENDKDFYQNALAKIEKVLKNNKGSKFTIKEFDNFRLYLNGIMHNRQIANENGYLKSLERLCLLISIFSATEIPISLKEIFSTQISLTPKKENKKLPVFFIIDATCSFIKNEVRDEFNNLVKDLDKILSNIGNVEFNYFVYNGNSIKIKNSKTNEKEIVEVNKPILNSIVKQLEYKLFQIEEKYKSNNISYYKPIQKIVIFLLGQSLYEDDSVNIEKHKPITNSTMIVPIRIDDKQYEENTKFFNQNYIYLKHEKLKMFFDWIYEVIKQIIN